METETNYIIEGMQERASKGSSISLINDDNGQWCFAEDGFQNIRIEKSDDLSTTYFCEAGWFEDTIEKAWANYVKREFDE